MIGLLISFVIFLVIVGIFYLISTKLIEAFSLPSVLVTVLQLVVVLAVLLWLLYALAGFYPELWGRVRL